MRAWPFRRGLLAAVLACALLGGAGCADDGKVGAAAQPTLRPSQRAVAAASGSPARPPTPSPSDSPNASARPRTPPLAGDVIAVDPGHNGGNATHPDSINQLVNVITEKKACDTTGAETDAGYPEHAFNFDVAIRLAKLLRKDGAKVVLTRHSDTGVGPCVTQRAAIGNRVHADAAISIHADGGPAGGPGSRSSNRVWYPATLTRSSALLADSASTSGTNTTPLPASRIRIMSARPG
ncbi:MAG TPA: N-acetylmuramoyl-L-alanine amidase [Streptosporangiaceae bacterium]|nr:N-acetylmuramoyl-L-alanine amidase [Streptosporangiaceae bacterium]